MFSNTKWKSSAWKQFTNLPLTSSRSLAMLRKELYWFSSRILFKNNHNNNTQNTIPYLHPILAKQLLFNHGTIYPRQASPLVCCMGFWPAYLYMSTVCESGVRSFGRLAEWRERKCFEWWSKVLPINKHHDGWLIYLQHSPLMPPPSDFKSYPLHMIMGALHNYRLSFVSLFIFISVNLTLFSIICINIIGSPYQDR